MTVLLFIVIFFAVFLAVEAVFRFFRLSADLTRKAAHVASGVLVLFFPAYLSKGEIVLLALFFAGVLVVTRLLHWFPSIHGVRRTTMGEILFPLGIALSALVFLPDALRAFQFGVLVLTFSDAFAAFFGSRYGKRKIRIGKHEKSLEGTIVFFLTTVVIGMFFGVSPIQMVPSAAALALVELVLVFGLDNIALPLLAGFAFYFFL